MARKTKYFTVTLHKHGILWWLFVGWWWRPIKIIFWIILSQVCGFRKIRYQHMR